MILGTVNARLEAKIQIKIYGSNGSERKVDAVIDTGFSGSLVLPAYIVEELDLFKRSGGSAFLADGTTCNYDNYGVEIEWMGTKKGVVASAVGNEVLAGMLLLKNHNIQVDVQEGGTVMVAPLVL